MKILGDQCLNDLPISSFISILRNQENFSYNPKSTLWLLKTHTSLGLEKIVHILYSSHLLLDIYAALPLSKFSIY